MYSKRYFQIQFDFAKKMSDLTGLPLFEALLSYTMFYRRLGLKGDPNPHNDTWQRYVYGLQDGKDPLEYFYELYTLYKNSKKDEVINNRFGNFRYEVDEDSIYTHFVPDTNAPIGPLKREVLEKRLEELKSLFREIKEKYPEIKWVRGKSWLYNLDSYKRLFPSEYYANPEVVTGRFQGSSSWAQFFKANGDINEDRVQEFYNNLKKLDPKNPHLVFPFLNLRVHAPIDKFYKFYGLY